MCAGHTQQWERTWTDVEGCAHAPRRLAHQAGLLLRSRARVRGCCRLVCRRCHVSAAVNAGAGGEPREAEVAELDVAACIVEDVGRLQVLSRKGQRAYNLSRLDLYVFDSDEANTLAQPCGVMHASAAHSGGTHITIETPQGSKEVQGSMHCSLTRWMMP